MVRLQNLEELLYKNVLLNQLVNYLPSLIDPVKPGLFYKHFCNWLFHWLIKSSIHHKSQTIGARDLTFWHNIHHQSHVMCHVSPVTGHGSQIGGASRWRVWYQRGPPRLVVRLLLPKQLKLKRILNWKNNCIQSWKAQNFLWRQLLEGFLKIFFSSISEKVPTYTATLCWNSLYMMWPYSPIGRPLLS